MPPCTNVVTAMLVSTSAVSSCEHKIICTCIMLLLLLLLLLLLMISFTIAFLKVGMSVGVPMAKVVLSARNENIMCFFFFLIQ